MLLAELREAIENLDVDGLTLADTVELFGLHDRLQAKMAVAVGQMDRDELYALDGAPTLTAWIKDRCRQSGADASRVAKLARKLRDLPATAAAWQAGEIGGGHVRAICDNVSARHVDKFAAIEGALLPPLAALSVTDAARVMQQWARAADDADPEDDPDERPDELRVSETLDGRRVISGHLSPDSAAEVEQALAHAMSDDTDVPLSQRQAEALVDVARFFNTFNAKPGSRRNRPNLTVIVTQDDDGEPVGRTLGGTPVSATTLKRWLCDGTVARMMTSKSVPLDYGTAVRTVAMALWLAVATRDQRCRWPGCDRPLSWCEAHHVVPAEARGPTSLDNLVLLCRRHHHKLHSNEGWTANLEPDGTFHVTSAAGETRTTVPPLRQAALFTDADGIDDGADDVDDEAA